MSCVSGVYSMNPGGVKRLNGCWSLSPFAPFIQQPSFPAPLRFSLQQPPPPFVVDLPHALSTLKVCAASRIGRYPVQRHRLPSKASSISSSDGSPWFRKRAYKLYEAVRVAYRLSGPAVRTITIPGVQNPHWLPLLFAIRSCTGCGCLALPIPSTVMTCLPSTLTNGARQALTEAWYILLLVGLY